MWQRNKHFKQMHVLERNVPFICCFNKYTCLKMLLKKEMLVISTLVALNL